MRDIVVVGSLNVDISVEAEHLPRPGETVRADRLVVGPGGKGLNQAVAAARLGGRVHLVGLLGEDQFAAIPETALKEAGVDTSYVRRTGEAPTGVALIVIDAASGQNQIAVAGGANRLLAPEHVAEAVAAFRAAGVVLVQLEAPLDAVEAALRLARECGARTVLDPAPARPLPDRVLELADILTPNETEAEILSEISVHDVESAARAGQRLRERTKGDVVVTLGERGCVWVHATGFVHFEAPRVEAVDTTGAGDAFNGGLAVALARGEPLERAIPYALEVASFSTTRRGAGASMPSSEELASRG